MDPDFNRNVAIMARLMAVGVLGVSVVAHLCAWVLAGGVCCVEQVPRVCIYMCMYVHVCMHH